MPQNLQPEKRSLDASQQGGYEVGGAEDVEAAADDAAGDAVEDRQNPGGLWLVDGEMGRYGPELALGDEDFVGVGDGHF